MRIKKALHKLKETHKEQEISQALHGIFKAVIDQVKEAVCSVLTLTGG